MRAGALVVVAALVACCPSQRCRTPSAVQPADCDGAGAHLAELQCVSAHAPDGRSFADVCRAHAAMGIRHDAACVVSAATCEQAEACK